jgi:hypothetical protein
MEDTSGFYKWDEINNEWFWGSNAVYNLNYTLLRELKDTYEYPVDSWYWYNERPVDPETI